MTLETTTDQAAAAISLTQIIQSARELANAGRYEHALHLLDEVQPASDDGRAKVAIAAAEIALAGEWFNDANPAASRIEAARRQCQHVQLEPATSWDLAFVTLCHRYRCQVTSDGRFTPGPAGKDLAILADLRAGAGQLREHAPDRVRQGWSEMYQGLIEEIYTRCALRHRATT